MNTFHIKQDYIKAVTEIGRIAAEADVSTANADLLSNAIREKDLLIPVVGEFSAGKSSFLNSFIGRKLLSVAVTPETAVATELRYSETEYAEALIKAGDSVMVKRISLEDAQNVQPDWQGLRLYIKSQNLKDIEPVILVDMPGFDSPKDDHNRAILSYLDKGAHYVVLTSVESGTVTATMNRQLQDIQNMGHAFSFFVSKANLRSAEDVESIVQEIKDQVEINLGVETTPKPLGKDDGKALSVLLESIDPNELFERLFKDAILQLVDEVESNIAIKISALKMDQNKSKQAIRDLEENLSKLAKRRDMMLMEAKTRNYDDQVESIVGAASSALSGNIDSFVTMAMNGSSGEAISQEMSSAIRNAVIPAVNAASKNISEKITAEFNLELSGLNEVFNSFDNPDLLAKITSVASSWGDTAKNSLMSFAASQQAKVAGKEAGTIYKAAVGALGIATNVLAPVIEIVLLFLPEIIGFFTKAAREREKREQVRGQIMGVIPQMKAKLRSELVVIFREQNEAAIEAISNEYDAKIQMARDEIQKAYDELENNADVVEKVQKLEKAKADIQSLKGTYFK